VAMSATPFLVGICGRSASGKSLFARALRERLSAAGHTVGCISMDDFSRELSADERERAFSGTFDFDCLEAFDVAALESCIQDAKQGREVCYARYDHACHAHTGGEPVCTGPCDIWVVEGLYLFALPATVTALFDFRVFMEVDADVSLARRVRRDVVERERDVVGVLDQYERFVKPAYDRLVQPSRSQAHICVIGGALNTPALESVVAHVNRVGKK